MFYPISKHRELIYQTPEEVFYPIFFEIFQERKVKYQTWEVVISSYIQTKRIIIIIVIIIIMIIIIIIYATDINIIKGIKGDVKNQP